MPQATLADLHTRSYMPNFTYTRSIPAASHNPSVDQPDMQINTNSTDDLIAVDHFSFNDNDGGLHKKVSLVAKTAPFPTPAGASCVLYGGTAGNLIFSNVALAGTGVQMTVGSRPPVLAAIGRTFLPGGLSLIWGSGTTVAGTLTQAYPDPLAVVYTASAVVVGAPPTTSFVSVNTLNLAQITVSSNNTTGNPTNVSVFWMVIGLA